MTAALAPIADLPAICPFCVAQGGLCGREECRTAVLPQLARNRGWLKMMGDVLTEQKKRQHADKLTAREKVEVARIGRRNARKVARSKRRGYVGLHLGMMGKRKFEITG